MAKSDQQLIAYRQLLDNALAMLHAARDERWDDLPSLDIERQKTLSNVMEVDLVSTQPVDIELRKMMIQSILDCDKQTQVLVQAHRKELHEVLSSMENGRKLTNAYRGT